MSESTTTSSQRSSHYRKHRSSGSRKKGRDSCQRLRVILLGDVMVGKTSILLRFVDGRFDPHVPRTIAIEEMEKEVTVDGQRYVVHVVDTCGGERFKSLRENFYRGTHVCLLTFALDSLSSFCNLTMWREEFLYYSDVPVGREFPFLVLGNKADVQERAVSDLNAQAWCRANGDVPYFETSAKEALNVEKVFVAAVRRYHEVASRNAPWRAREANPEGIIRDLTEQPGDEKSETGSGGCCS